MLEFYVSVTSFRPTIWILLHASPDLQLRMIFLAYQKNTALKRPKTILLLEEYSFISSRGRSLRRRTLQDLIVHPSVSNSDFQNLYPTFRRSSVRVKLGLRFFDSLESMQFKSVVSFRELVQIRR